MTTDPCSLSWCIQEPALIEHFPIRNNGIALMEIFLEEPAVEFTEVLLPELGVREWLHYKERIAATFPQLLEKHFDKPVWTWLKWKTPGIKATDIIDYLCRMQKRYGPDRIDPVVSLIKACYPRRQSFHDLLDQLRRTAP